MQRKRKKTKTYFYIAIILLIICLSLIAIININKDNKEESFEKSNIKNNNEVQYKNDVSVDEIKNETGFTADSNLYKIDTEYDGRKVLNIKADIQYKVAFAGIIKKQKIEMNEVEKILNENYPNHNGIWIEESSRKKIVEMIKENTKYKYKINEKGYLIIEDKKESNDNDIILERLINSDKKVILTINSIYYEVDNVTGDIVEYPFEKLDNYQPFDIITSDKNPIVVISSNKENRLSNKKIIEEMLIALEECVL